MQGREDQGKCLIDFYQKFVFKLLYCFIASVQLREPGENPPRVHIDRRIQSMDRCDDRGKSFSNVIYSPNVLKCVWELWRS